MPSPELAIAGAVLAASGPLLRQRRKRPDPGDETRRRILEVLCFAPGLNQSELAQRVGIGWGNIKHHLHRLVDFRRVSKVESAAEKRYFLFGHQKDEMERIALLRRGRVLEVVMTILRQPGIPQYELTRRTSLTRKILRSYVDLLVQRGLIREIKAPALNRYYPTPQLEQVMTRLPPEDRETLLAPTGAPASGPPSEASSAN